VQEGQVYCLFKEREATIEADEQEEVQKEAKTN
jgi:hypothetical protein